MSDFVTAIAGAAVSEGMLVYVTGKSDGSITVAKTTASTDVPLGIACETVDANERVRVQVTGVATGIASGVITAGTHIRLKPAADGELAASPAAGDAVAAVFVRSLKGDADAAANDHIQVVLTPGCQDEV